MVFDLHTHHHQENGAAAVGNTASGQPGYDQNAATAQGYGQTDPAMGNNGETGGQYTNGPNVDQQNDAVTGTGTDRTTGEHHGRFKNTAEGAAVGGVAGHEWEKHRGGDHGAGTGAAVGGVAGNEYNRHHGGRGPAVSNNQNTIGDTTGRGANTGPGMGANAAGLGTTGGPQAAAANQSSGNTPANREARHLARTGTIEKALGSVICSTTLQQHGLEKQAQAANMEGQHQNLNEAQQLEAQAKLKRGQAVGLGADPAHGNVGASLPSQQNVPGQAGGPGYGGQNAGGAY